MAHDMIHTLVLMNKYPIHKNLSTSFVNLAALVRHLRGVQFVGTVEIELSSYEAEIEFSENGALKAREQDHIAGRLSFGEDALQRIMIRAKEHGGTINVYKNGTEKRESPVFVDKKIAEGARKMSLGDAASARTDKMEDFLSRASFADAPIPKPATGFDADSVENWTELVGLVSEVIQTVEESMAKGNLNFAEAFRNACGFISFDYPFLDPDTDIFSYADGYITLRRKMIARDLIGGVMAALARMMERLREDPYYGNLCHLTMHRLRVLANRRRLQFDVFGLGKELQKITGI